MNKVKVLTSLVLLILCASSAFAQYEKCLFFSEYIEGSSYNKAVEIYNATENVIDLSDVQIVLYSNGSSTPTSTATLNAGTLGIGEVYVVCHPSAGAEIQAVADQTSGTINYNGDDAFVLLLSGAVVDVIGQIGFDPGYYWGLDDVTTQNHTLVRFTSICCGDDDGTDAFDPTLEWTGYPEDTFSYLGEHDTECQAVPEQTSSWGEIKALFR